VTTYIITWLGGGSRPSTIEPPRHEPVDVVLLTPELGVTMPDLDLLKPVQIDADQ
jgi:hypothetical protein